MSGNDERMELIYAPECECGQCNEWSTDKYVWILTKRSLLLRHIAYPVITFDMDKKFSYLEALANITYIKCQNCKKKYERGSEKFEAVMRAFRANAGKPICRGVRGDTFLWK